MDILINGFSMLEEGRTLTRDPQFPDIATLELYVSCTTEIAELIKPWKLNSGQNSLIASDMILYEASLTNKIVIHSDASPIYLVFKGRYIELPSSSK